MDERERAIRAVAEELHLREQYGSEPDPEVLVRCVLEAGERDDERARLTVPETVDGMGAMRVSSDPERFVYGDPEALGWLRERLEAIDASEVDDERRGRAFLERLGMATERSDEDAYLAGAALFDLLEMHEPADDIEEREVAALGRVLRGSE